MTPAAQSGAARKPSNILGNTTVPLHTGPKPAPDKALRGYRKAEKFDLQRVAQGLLWKDTGTKRQKHRVCHCCRSMQGEKVGVYRAVDGSRARFSGLMMCGSGWTCPICSQVITEQRREELSAALVGWVKQGGRCHLLTFTFPHEADEPLADLLPKFDRARQRFQNSRLWKGVKADYEAAGTVTSLEVTHGANGWHPHLHMLLFVRQTLPDDVQARLIAEWVRQLVNAKLGSTPQLADMMRHALDIRGGEDAAAYVTKYGREETWGLSSEVTRSHAKEEAADASLKPFGLLRRAAAGDARSAELFKEFAEEFFGKRLLTWAPGLRDKLALPEEQTDEAIAEAEPMPEENRIGSLSPEQWRVVLQRNARAELLEYAAKSCVDPDTGQGDLDDFVQWLADSRPPSNQGKFIFAYRQRSMLGGNIYA